MPQKPKQPEKTQPSAPAQQSPLPTGDIWEQALRTLQGPVYSAYTKAPMEIENRYATYNEILQKRGKAAADKWVQFVKSVQGPDPTSGEYDPVTNSGKITIQPWATWNDYKHTLLHETAHSVFKGEQPPSTYDIPNKYTTMGLWDAIKKHFSIGPVSDPAFPDSSLDKKYVTGFEEAANNPGNQAYRVWENSKRAGIGGFEIPVYMSVFKPGQLKDVTQENSDAFVQRYFPLIRDDKKRKQMESIYNSSKAQKPK